VELLQYKNTALVRTQYSHHFESAPTITDIKLTRCFTLYADGDFQTAITRTYLSEYNPAYGTTIPAGKSDTDVYLINIGIERAAAI